MAEGRVTGKDVAIHAGVTTATVSNVLNGKSNVSEETRKRVMASVRELGYVPNQVAKSLRRRNGRSIGVVIEKNLSNPRYGRTMEGMLRQASNRAYRLVLCRNRRRDDGVYDYIAAYFERQVDGIVFVSRDTENPDPECIEIVMQKGIPFVALDCQNSDVPYSTVDFDYREAAQLITTKACEHGERRVVYVRPAVKNAQEELREEGVREACAEAPGCKGLEIVTADVNSRVQESPWDFDGESDNFSKPSEAYLRDVRDILEQALGGVVRPGDAIVSSWAGWSNILSRTLREPGLIFADLASDYLSVLGADIFCEMPNFDAGVASVDAVIDAIEGKEPSAQTLPVSCCDMLNSCTAVFP